MYAFLILSLFDFIIYYCEIIFFFFLFVQKYVGFIPCIQLCKLDSLSVSSGFTNSTLKYCSKRLKPKIWIRCFNL